MSYKINIKTIPGKKEKDIMMFSLSDTCIWCHKTKELLKEMGLEFSYVDVDLLNKEEQAEAYKDMWKYSPNTTSFPTVIINHGEFVFSGFSEGDIKAVL